MRCSSSIPGAEQPYEPLIRGSLGDTGAAGELSFSTISLGQAAKIHRVCAK